MAGGAPPGSMRSAWCRQVAALGAGEILLTSMDRDGTGLGFDLDLLRAVCGAVRVPVIASGGVGTLEHFVEGARAGATGLLAASVFHFGTFTIAQVKADAARGRSAGAPAAPGGLRGRHGQVRQEEADAASRRTALKPEKLRKPEKQAAVAAAAAEAPPLPPVALGPAVAAVLDRLWSVVMSRRTRGPVGQPFRAAAVARHRQGGAEIRRGGGGVPDRGGGRQS